MTRIDDEEETSEVAEMYTTTKSAARKELIYALPTVFYILLTK